MHYLNPVVDEYQTTTILILFELLPIVYERNNYFVIVRRRLLEKMALSKYMFIVKFCVFDFRSPIVSLESFPAIASKRSADQVLDFVGGLR